jgi:hypothetical protein
VVPGPVLALVVHARRASQRLQDPGPGPDPLGLVGVEPDALGPAEGGWLLPDPVGDGHPPKVVQQRRVPEVGGGLGAEAEQDRGPCRQGGP